MREYAETLRAALAECEGNTELNTLYTAASTAAMRTIKPLWNMVEDEKTACYFSAEFLLGRIIYANLYNLGQLEQLNEVFTAAGLDPNMFETVEDDALGNGGLGRLAACFLDSAATCGLALNGFGIRYQYGLFHQYFEEGFQREAPDDWQRFGDPWSERREGERVQIDFKDHSVWAVPYDMPIIGYGNTRVNNLRLWQAEPMQPFDFDSFNNQNYEEAYRKQNEAAAISAILYPNDDTKEGKCLRLKQQYFFSSASLQSLLQQHKARYGSVWEQLPKHLAIQLNDTHPTVAIPELLRLLMAGQQLSFEDAFAIVQGVFAYTNHTIMAEALEKWDVTLFCEVIPEVYPYVVMLQNHLAQQLAKTEIAFSSWGIYNIIEGGRIHMARMAVFATHSVNGVAAIHSDILKTDVLKEWYALYPGRFNNKTNGITQRRWLGLCNPELAAFITKRIGAAWLTNLDELQKLVPYADDLSSLQEFCEVKSTKKKQLADYIHIHEHGFEVNTSAVFDVQIKRLHEYKRQLLNAFSLLDIYFALKEGQLPNFYPMVCLFGAKAAPGYKRAKGIIKFINEIAKKLNADPDTKDQLQILFVQNYNVSYAEKLIPAADISEQISTAGTEASGTGNMKLMLNGAVTLGTFDGANIEIVQESGEENNYIFGARVEDIAVQKGQYTPQKLYDENPRLRRVMDTLVDGTFGDGKTGLFEDLYTSILEGASWHTPDPYYLLLDFIPYVEAKLRANADAANSVAFARKCLLNTAFSGKFSSDRTVRQYATEIWGL